MEQRHEHAENARFFEKAMAHMTVGDELFDLQKFEEACRAYDAARVSGSYLANQQQRLNLASLLMRRYDKLFKRGYLKNQNKKNNTWVSLAMDYDPRLSIDAPKTKEYHLHS